MNFENYEKTIEQLNQKAFENYQNGNLENAIDCFEQLFVHDPYNKDTYFNLAKVYYELGKFDKCKNILLGLLDLGDKDDYTFILLGDAYIELEKYSDALICYNRVSDTNLVEQKINSINEILKQKEDKVYQQYMNYPYPNTWKIRGIPEHYFKLINYSGPERRRYIKTIQHLDINYLQLKYWNQYKDLRKTRVLNAGCGTGEGLVQFAFMYPEVEIVAIDISAQSINIAKEHAQKLKVNNIKFVQKDILEVDPEELGYFDFIVSTGVIHHLYSPLQGIKKLKNVLKDHGVIGGMVYATIGRREVYDFREIFDMMFSEVEQMDFKLNSTKELLNSLQAWQRLDRIKLFNDIKMGDQGIVDLLLNANETSYTTKELTELFEQTDMNSDLYANNYLNPLFWLYNIKNTELKHRLKILNEEQKMQIAEIYNGSIIKHHFVAYKRNLKPNTNLLFTDSWLDAFPILWHVAPVGSDEKGCYIDLKFRANPDGLSQYIIAGEQKEQYIRYDITQEEYKFLNKCKGKLSVKQIMKSCSSKLEIKDVKKLLFNLWQMDVLFLRKNKEMFYNEM